MQIHVSLKSVPELQSLRRDVQRRIWRASLSDAHAFSRWQVWIPWACYCASAIVLLIAPMPTNNFALGIWILYLMSSGPCIAALGMFNIQVRLAQRYLRRRVDDEFGPRCWTCGYDLRVTPGKCPECGTIANPAAAMYAKV